MLGLGLTLTLTNPNPNPNPNPNQVDARAVPAGCTYSHASRMAVFNTNRAGACSAEWECYYELVCVAQEAADPATDFASTSVAKDGETCPGHPHILRSSPTCQEKLDKARQKGGEETDVTASAKDVAEPKTDVGDVKTDVTAPTKDGKKAKGIADPSKDGKKPKMDVTGAGSKMDVAGAGSRGGAPMTDREVADFTGRAVLRSAACDVGPNPDPYPNPNPNPNANPHPHPNPTPTPTPTHDPNPKIAQAVEEA